MLVRLCVHVSNPEDIAKISHATRYEPCHIVTEEGIVGFIVPYGKVEAILNKFAKAGADEFTAHLLSNQQEKP